MTQDLLLKFFPAPKFLTRPAVGFDVSDQTIKFMELAGGIGHFSLGRFGSIDIPVGVMEGGELKQPDVFKDLLAKIKAQYRFDNIFMSLPDDRAFTLNLTLPAMNSKEVAGSIELQLQEHVPLPPAEVVFDFDALPALPETKEFEVGVSVLPRSIVSIYEKVFAEAGFNLLAIETQGEALARTLTERGTGKNEILVDLGKNHTAIFWVKSGVLIHAAAPPVGGAAITRSLEKNLKLEEAEAEKVKLTKGLSRADEDLPVFTAIVPVVSAIKDEIGRRVDFWLANSADPKTEIEKIILIGGQASLPGLAEYLSVNLNRPVELGNPWQKVFSKEKVINKLPYNEALRYGTALGLALRNYLN